MLPGRVVALSPDQRLRKHMGVALMAAGASVTPAAELAELPPGEIEAEVVVVHVPAAGDVAGAVRAVCERTGSQAHIVLLLPASELETTVAAMQVDERVAAVLAADRVGDGSLAATVSRLLYGDIFGLDRLSRWGTRIHSTLVGDYQEKSMCIAEVSQFAESMGVRRKYREAIEQCADEMLMNALYDAPVDAGGRSLFADVPIKERLAVQSDHKVIVQYACDGSRFYLAVRDRYGTLARDTVIRYLDKCLHAEQQIDDKTGGAGLGLYMMASSASTFLFNVLPGRATECVCAFDLAAAKLHLCEFGFYRERVDASGRLAAPSRRPAGVGVPVERRSSRPPPANRWVMLGLSSAIALLLTLIGLIAYPRLVDRTGALQVATEPRGAIVEVEGRDRGSTDQGPITIAGLESDRGYRVVARREGYRAAESFVEPVAGETTEIALRLEPRAASVTATSEPEGATVTIGDRVLGATPVAVTDLPPGSEIELTLRKPGYRPTVRRVEVPGPGGSLIVSASLELSDDVGSVRIDSDPPGARVYQNGERLAALETPVPELILPANETVELTLELPGYESAVLPVTVQPGERGELVSATLRRGGTLSLRASLPVRATVRGVPDCRNLALPARCSLPNGSYRVRVDNADPFVREDLTVEIDGADVVRQIDLGTVHAGVQHRIVLPGGRRVERAAFRAGRQRVKLLDLATGEAEDVAVDVPAGGRVRLPAGSE